MGKAIIKIHLEYPYEDGVWSKQDIEEELENMEVPSNYVEDSFEIVSIGEDKIKEDK